MNSFKHLLRVVGHGLIPALLLSSHAAPAAAADLVETFNSVCADTFPSFKGIDEKVEALGGQLEVESEPAFSRVPFVLASTAMTGSTNKHTKLIGKDDVAIDYAEGVSVNLPAAGCSVWKRGDIDDATLKRLLNGFETTTFLGELKETLLSGGPTRAWVVQLKRGRAVLTIMEGRSLGNIDKVSAVRVALVRFDETFIDQLVTHNTTLQGL